MCIRDRYAGANGYLLKKYVSDKLIHSIREVLDGGAPMSPSIARMVISNMQKGIPFADNDYQLTNREKEILQHTISGYDAKRIASILDISVLTIRKHIANIYQKLHVSSKAQIITLAHKNNWI